MLNSYEDCAILILSCDKNEFLLNIFFDFLNRNWCDCPFEKYLGIESKDMKFEGVHTLKSPKGSFCSRIKEYLRLIEKKYVLIILDDFILEEHVDNEKMNEYYTVIKSDEKIATLTLAWIDGIEKNYSSNIMKKSWNSNFLINLQVGFWRTEVLENILKDGENAWEAELLGSVRARRYKDKKLFLHLASDDDMPYKYNRGWLMVKGAWNGNEIKRLGLEAYAPFFLDGKKILYDNFGKQSKLVSAKIRFSVFARKALSIIGVYF